MAYGQIDRYNNRLIDIMIKRLIDKAIDILF